MTVLARQDTYSTRIKDASLAIRHSRGRILFYTAGSRNELEGVGAVATRELYPRKRYVFLIKKYVEDARQDEKHVPDLLEAIMRSTDPVKEELRPILFTTTKLDPTSQNSSPKSQKSWFHAKIKSPKKGLPNTPRQFSKRPTPFCDIWAR